jgi:hypothetical protein
LKSRPFEEGVVKWKNQQALVACMASLSRDIRYTYCIINVFVLGKQISEEEKK